MIENPEFQGKSKSRCGWVGEVGTDVTAGGGVGRAVATAYIIPTLPPGIKQSWLKL